MGDTDVVVVGEYVVETDTETEVVVVTDTDTEVVTEVE